MFRIFDLRQTPVTDSTSIQIDIVIVKDIAPDYETVDTVYLTIVVEDVNTVEGERQITGLFHCKLYLFGY